MIASNNTLQRERGFAGVVAGELRWTDGYHAG